MQTPKEDVETLEEQTRIQLLSRGNYTCRQKPLQISPKEPKYQQILQLKNEISENAQKISAIVKTIPQYNQYFQPILEEEHIQLGELKEDTIEECTEENTPTKLNMTSKFISLKTRYYEQTWQEQIQNTPHQKTLQVFINSVQSMIEMLKSLQNKGIIHFNIHTKTMLASEMRHTPILSNFNLSFKIEELQKEMENLFPNYTEYAPWPIEVYLASQIANLKEKQEQWETYLVTKEQMDNWIHTFTETSIYKRLASEERRELLRIQLTAYFQPIINKSIKTLYENIIENAKTWDTYSMCILWIDTFILLALHEKIGKYNFIRDFTELMKTIIYANPNARPSVEYLENAIYEILVRVPQDEYDKFIVERVQPEEPEDPEERQEPEEPEEEQEEYKKPTIPHSLKI